MKIFKLLSVVCAVVLVGTALTSCDYSGNSTSQEVLPSLKVEKHGTAEPTVSYDSSARIKVEVQDEQNGIAKDIVKTVDQGDGEEIKEGQSVSISYIYYVMPGFEKQNSSWDEGATPIIIPALKNEGNETDIGNLLIGLKVGAVLAIAQPGFSQESQTLDTTGSNYSLQIIVVNSTKEPVTKADGEPVLAADLNPELPKVTLANDGTPSIEIPKGFKFAKTLQSEQLKIGKGKEITDSTVVSFAYTAWDEQGAKIQSTWDSKLPLSTTIQTVNEGWKEVLKDATVGSQYLIIVPPSMVSTTEAGESSGSQIFVVDVLDIVG